MKNCKDVTKMKKEAKIKVLKKMITIIKDPEWFDGICVAFEDITGEAFGMCFKVFPEFLKYKPKKQIDQDYWWEPSQHKKRIGAINKVINDIKNNKL